MLNYDNINEIKVTEIHDIKDNIIGTPFNSTNSISFIIFLLFLFFIFLLYWKKDKKSELPKKEKVNIDFNKLINEFEIKFSTLSKDLFYSRILEILKLFLEEKKWKPFTKMTFKEIKSLKLDKKLENLIEWIYFKEFKKEIDDSEESRKLLFLEVKKLILS